MSSFGLRPSFSHVLEFPEEEARDRIVKRIQTEASSYEVKSFPGFVCLRVPPRDRHFWSPRLNLSLDPEGDGKTMIHGTYGPNAHMWSTFLYFYLIVGSLGLFSGILGYCQWKLDMTAWGLWVFYAMLGLALVLYLVAQFGQKIGAQQTFALHQIYEKAVERQIIIH